MNYWIFQGKPDAYDFKSAIADRLLKEWNVTAHKNRIQAGDKAIIWITGKMAGCYALADVVSNPDNFGESVDSHLWNVNSETGRKHKMRDKSAIKVAIKITHNLFDAKPILWDEIKNMVGFEKLKVGIAGTNFSSSKEEYELMQKLIESRFA